jgi:hypothetical protein
MKAIILCILLTGLSVLAADTNDIQIATRTYKIMPEDSLATVETFTRGGQTNLVRNTHTKDGVVVLRSQNFYHNGTEVGIYMSGIGDGKSTAVSSTPGTPYYFYVGFDSSNQPHSAHITATNLVTLDWFFCTNGVFYPVDSSIIREFNGRMSKNLLPH